MRNHNIFTNIFRIKNIKEIILIILLLSTNTLGFETSDTHIIGDKNIFALKTTSDFKLILTKDDIVIKTWLKEDFSIKEDIYITYIEYPKTFKSGEYALILVTEDKTEVKKIIIKRSFKTWINNIIDEWIMPFINTIKSFI